MQTNGRNDVAGNFIPTHDQTTIVYVTDYNRHYMQLITTTHVYTHVVYTWRVIPVNLWPGLRGVQTQTACTWLYVYVNMQN